MNLTGIPDLDYVILNNLDDRDLVTYCQVNTEASQVCRDDNFWMNRAITKFPYVPKDVFSKSKGIRQWNKYYIDILRNIEHNPNYYFVEGSKRGKLDWVMIAVHNGADIHTDDNNALIYASKTGNLDLVKYLFALGMKNNINDALSSASERGHLPVVKYLLDNGADINYYQGLALSSAVTHGHLPVVKYLLDNGADTKHITDISLDRAKRRGHTDVINYLSAKGLI